MWLRRILSLDRDGNPSWFKIGFMAVMTAGLSLAVLAALEAPRIWDQTTLAQADWIKSDRRTSPWPWIGLKWVATVTSIFGVFPMALLLSGVLAVLFRVNQVMPGHVPPTRAYIVVILPLTAFFVSLGLVLSTLGQTLRHLAGSGLRALRGH